MNHFPVLLNALKHGAAALEAVEALDLQHKADGSPVTAADMAVARAVRRSLTAELDASQHDIIDEESFAEGALPDFASDKTLWLVDPLAGTGCYADHLPFYAIAIGAMRHGEPVAGGVYYPASDELYISADGKAQHITHAFSDNAQAVAVVMPVEKARQPYADNFYDHGASEVAKRYGLHKSFKQVLRLPVINQGLLWIGTSRVAGGIFHPFAWDLAAAWPILKAAGISLYDTENGGELTSLSRAWLNEKMRFKNPLLVCAPSRRDAYFSRLSACRNSY